MTNSSSLLGLLVGMHFHPPASAILASLPSGARLIIVPEPDNPYDSHAMRVEVEVGEIPQSELEGSELALKLSGYGMQPEDLGDTIMLGHLASSIGKPFRSAQAKGEIVSAGCIDFERSQIREGVLEFGVTGAPLVRGVRQAEGEDEFEELASGENNPDV